MADRTVSVRLQALIGPYQAQMAKATASTREFGAAVHQMNVKGDAGFKQLSTGALLAAGGLAVGLDLSAKAAIDWESAWAGVTKTVDGSASQMAVLEDGLRGLAKELPATHGEIAAVAEAAGQLGIQRPAIEGFTRTMIDLGETTNLTADQAATSMARMANIMQTPQAEIGRMASTLVALGNAGASTESEILDMSLRIASAGAQVGLTEAEVLSFSNALSSVGIEAEAGGSSISRVFATIATAVADSGDDLAKFAAVAGVSAEEFSAAFRDDAAGATIQFIEGLDRVKASGGNVFATLKDLELGDIRVQNALLSAAGAGDLFRESLDLGAQAWQENIALTQEAEKRYDTTAAKLEVARNNVVDLGIDMGTTLLPAIASVAGGMTDMATGFGELPGFAKTAALSLTGITAAGLGTVGLVGTLGPKIETLHTTLGKMGAGGQFVSRHLGAMGLALGAAGVGVAALSYFLGQQADQQAQAEASVDAYTQAILDQSGAIEDNVNLSTANQLMNSEAGRIMQDVGFDFMAAADHIRTGNDALGDSFNATGSDMISAATNIDALRENLEGGELAMTPFIDELLRLNETGELTDDQVRIIANEIAGLTGNYGEASTAAEIQNAFLRDTGTASIEAAPQLGAMAEALGLNAEQAAAANKEFKELQDSYRASIDPLFAMLDAIDGNRQAQAALTEANLANLDSIKDNNVGAEEMGALYRDVADSALDVEVRARDLAKAVQDGTVNIDQASSMLAEWVAQGLLTEDQAANVAYQFGVAAGKADDFAGDYVANAFANTAPAIAAWQKLLDKISETFRVGSANAHISINQAERLLSAGGGLVPHPAYLAGGGSLFAPSGTDTVPAMLTPGEFVIRKAAVDRLGVGTLHALNRLAGGGPVGLAPGGEVPSGFELTQAMHTVGAMSDATYAQHLSVRLTQFRQFSSEWMSAQQELTSLMSGAEQARAASAQDATKASADAYEERREINDNLYELGLLSTEDHLFNLQRRADREVEYSDEWMALQAEMSAVRQDVLDDERRIEDARYELGEISQADYLTMLRERLAAAEEYSQEYLSLLGEIQDAEAAAFDQARRLDDARYELGEIATADYLAMLRDRLTASEKYSGEYMAIWRDIQRLEEQTVNALPADWLAGFAAQSAVSLSSQINDALGFYVAPGATMVGDVGGGSSIDMGGIHIDARGADQAAASRIERTAQDLRRDLAADLRMRIG